MRMLWGLHVFPRMLDCSMLLWLLLLLPLMLLRAVQLPLVCSPQTQGQAPGAGLGRQAPPCLL